jgi:hypothetical protein
MPLIDDVVRSRFPGLSDAEIQAFYDAAIEARERNKAIEILETDLGLATIARELGWQALKEYLVSATGSDTLSYDDIFSLAIAANNIRLSENAQSINAMFASASEVSSKKTANARKKSIQSILKPLEKFKVVDI